MHHETYCRRVSTELPDYGAGRFKLTLLVRVAELIEDLASAEHAAMARFEAHQAALQQLATQAETGGSGRQRSAARRRNKPRQTAVGRDTPIM